MSTDNDLVFGMNCGCLIDTKSLRLNTPEMIQEVLGTVLC